MGLCRIAATASLVVAGCAPHVAITPPPPPRAVVPPAPVPREDAFRSLLIANVGSWSDPLRLLVDVRGNHATVVTSAPPGVRVLEGTLTAGKLDVTEHTTRPKALSIVGTRDGDIITAEWREGRDRYAFTTRKPVPFAPRHDDQPWSGWAGAGDRVRVRLHIEHDALAGAVLHLSGAENTLTGTLDALGQVHLEESRGDHTIAVWQGAFLDPTVLVGFRSSDGAPDRLFTLGFSSTYPAEIALWNGIALAPEVYHAESSPECWADTTLFHVTGLPDAQKTNALDLEIARFIGVGRLDVAGCFGGRERWATVTWKKPPFAQLQLDSNSAGQGAGRCTIVDLERGRVVKLFDLVKDHAGLDRFVSAASRSVRCYTEEDRKPGSPAVCNDVHVSAATGSFCMEGNDVVVEDDDAGLGGTTVPKSDIARFFDVRSPIGRGLLL
jgi:hypothetical protein